MKLCLAHLFLLARIAAPLCAHGSADTEAVPAAAPREFAQLLPETASAIPDGETKITVRANVGKAAVYLNGTFEGTGTVTLRNLVRGQYHLRVEKSGYEPKEYMIQVEAGRAETFFVNLEKVGE